MSWIYRPCKPVSHESKYPNSQNYWTCFIGKATSLYQISHWLKGQDPRKSDAAVHTRFIAPSLWDHRKISTCLLSVCPKMVSYTVKPVCNDHLSNEIYYLWFIQSCVLMKTDGTIDFLTISAFWNTSRCRDVSHQVVVKDRFYCCLFEWIIRAHFNDVLF